MKNNTLHPRLSSTALFLALTFLLLLAGAAGAAGEAADAATTVSAAEVEDVADRRVEAAYQFALAKMLAEESSFHEAQRAFERALELSDQPDPYALVEMSRFHSDLAQISRSAEGRRQQLVKAADLAAEARRLAPRNPDVLLHYAQVHLRLGERQLASLDLALEAFEELHEMREGDVQVLTSLGQIYLWKRDSAKAAEVLREATAYMPNHRMIQTMLVDALFDAGDLASAEVELARLVEMAPDSLEKRLQLAELRSENGDHRGAAQALQEAPPEVLEDVRVRHFLARELHLAGDNEAALELVDGLAGELPGAGLERLRVAILAGLTRYGAAIRALEPLYDGGADAARRLQDTMLLSRLYERVGRMDDAVEVLRSQIDRVSEEERLQLRMALAGALERHGRVEEAVSLLEGVLARPSLAPRQRAFVGSALAETLLRVDRGEEALAVLEGVLEHLPAPVPSPEAAPSEEPEASNGEAESAGQAESNGDGASVANGPAALAAGIELRRLALLAELERWSEVESGSAALFEHPNAEVRSASRQLHAEALAELGRLPEALARLAASDEDERLMLAKQVELELAHGSAEKARAQIEAVAAGGEADDLFFAARLYQQEALYDDVVRLTTRLLELEPESLQALFLHGAAQERAGARQESIATFERLLALEPDYAPALNYLGYMLAEKGERLEEAERLVIRALAIDPDNGAYVDSLGWVYYQMERYPKARQQLEWASRLIPEDPTVFEHLGDLYLELGEVELARQAYREAVEIAGDNVETARRKLADLEER